MAASERGRQQSMLGGQRPGGRRRAWSRRGFMKRQGGRGRGGRQGLPRGVHPTTGGAGGSRHELWWHVTPLLRSGPDSCSVRDGPHPLPQPASIQQPSSSLQLFNAVWWCSAASKRVVCAPNSPAGRPHTAADAAAAANWTISKPACSLHSAARFAATSSQRSATVQPSVHFTAISQSTVCATSNRLASLSAAALGTAGTANLGADQ